MTHPPLRSPRYALALVAALGVALLVAASARAQPIAELLPADTALALGARDLAEHADKLEPFIAEFERLGLAEALAALGGAPTDDVAGDLENEIPEAFADLEPLDLIGREAWIALSISPFNPLPVGTLVARVTPEARDAFVAAFADAAAREDVERFSESDLDFYIVPVDADQAADMPLQALVAAQAGDLVMLTSDPDAMRGLLRRYAGADEPSFATSDGYTDTFGRLGEGTLYGYLDLATVAEAAAPFAQPLGLPQLVERLQEALATAGASAGVVRLVDDGVESASVLAPDPSGADLALYNLLTRSEPWDPAFFDLMPPTGLSVATGNVDLAGWWNYLNDFVASVPELGISSLDELLASVGVDLRSSFFDWYGGDYGLVTTGVTQVPTSGELPDNLLGDSVYAFASTDAEAARSGLALLLNNVAVTAAAFADPSGGAGGAEIDAYDVAGTEVTRYAIFDGVALSTAVVDGLALIGTSDDAMRAGLEARADGQGLPATLATLASGLPEDARYAALSDNRATVEATAQQLAGQLELFAGLGGSAGLDFEATESASAAVEEFLTFVASRLGGTVASTRVEGNLVLGSGFSEVDW